MRENGTGNVYVTQQVIINTDPNVRVAATEIESSVYPNPTYQVFENTIRFKLTEASIVKLELIGENGIVIKKLAESEHSAGEFEYPFTLKSTQFKAIETIFYRLTVNGVSETKRIILN